MPSTSTTHYSKLGVVVPTGFEPVLKYGCDFANYFRNLEDFVS